MTLVIWIVIICIAVYGYSTRQRLIKIADYLDRKHLQIDSISNDHTQRIGELEATSHKYTKHLS